MTWHYGLMARWWAEFNTSSQEEAAYFGAAIERSGEPALELACGTGRVLLPLLRAGHEVDGCDLSPDMIALCGQALAREGFFSRLYVQPMHELDLPRRYGTIYICDSFGLGGQRNHDIETLRRCWQHLIPGGTLLFNHYLPYDDPVEWALWLPENQHALPELPPEPGTGERRHAANGDVLELWTGLVDLDPAGQRATRAMRISLWRDDELLEQEEHLLMENLYFRNELLMMLEQAGFTGVTVEAGYSGALATDEDTMVTFVARREL
jgi:SAM-dependent methyltransferase